MDRITSFDGRRVLVKFNGVRSVDIGSVIFRHEIKRKWADFVMSGQHNSNLILTVVYSQYI